MQNTPEQARGSQDAKRWAGETAARFGNAVSTERRRHGWSAVQLASRTAALGYPITRTTIAKIEGNHRASKIDVAEVVILAEALEVPPLQLLYPDQPCGVIEHLPHNWVESIGAAQHFSGEISLPGREDSNVMEFARQWSMLTYRAERLQRRKVLGEALARDEELQHEALRNELKHLKTAMDAADFYNFNTHPVYPSTEQT